ncbi:MAG: antibiotic biosynthesis monooxygenase family protein [bacterium]
MYMYMLEYHVKNDRIQEFEAAYGINGKWVQLFKQGDGYQGTELHSNLENKQRYVTINYWASQKACETFRCQFAKEFKALDEACESLTKRTLSLGSFCLCQP